MFIYSNISDTKLPLDGTIDMIDRLWWSTPVYDKAYEMFILHWQYLMQCHSNDFWSARWWKTGLNNRNDISAAHVYWHLTFCRCDGLMKATFSVFYISMHKLLKWLAIQHIVNSTCARRWVNWVTAVVLFMMFQSGHVPNNWKNLKSVLTVPTYTPFQKSDLNLILNRI